MRVKNPNIYYELEDCYKLCIIYKNNLYYTYFDKNVYKNVNKYHWRISNGNCDKKYVITNLPRLNGIQRTLLMHHLIMNFKYNKIHEIDHINGNGLDNRYSNLRIVTKHQNLCNKCKLSNNTSGIAGIYFDTSRNKYAVDIRYNNIRVRLGRYNSVAEATYVRILAEQYIFKEYRYTLDDNYKYLLCNDISSDRKRELELYVNNKIININY